MRNPRLIVAVSAILMVLAASADAQTPSYKAPRTPDGHPNLNGIWEAINTANWDLQAHSAQPSHVLSLGAQGAEPGGIDHLVGEEEILAEAGPRHALHLGDGGAGEPRVAVGGLARRQCRALVRLHVGPQPVPRQGLRHGAEVGLESRCVDHECRRRELRGLHRRQASDPSGRAARDARVLSAR